MGVTSEGPGLEELRSYLLGKVGVSEEIPFGPQALVYKVGGKMFALLAWELTPLRVTLKCEPERAVELRSVFPAIRGAYHFNKRHWNMIELNGTVPTAEVLAMVDHSYELVVARLPRAVREGLA